MEIRKLVFSFTIIYAGKRESGMGCEEMQDNEIGSVNLNSERIFVLFNYATCFLFIDTFSSISHQEL